jgi:hypothetical protein
MWQLCTRSIHFLYSFVFCGTIDEEVIANVGCGNNYEMGYTGWEYKVTKWAYVRKTDA